MMTDDNTVHRVKATAGGFGNGRTRTQSVPRAYHTDRNCSRIRNLPDERVTETAVEEATRQGLTECDYCSGNREWEYERPTCPFCGSEVGDLPSHLPKCDKAPG